ncbi:hypothetical protein LXL04_000040 [Taraxacum kok-saghyz]
METQLEFFQQMKLHLISKASQTMAIIATSSNNLIKDPRENARPIAKRDGSRINDSFPAPIALIPDVQVSNQQP